MKDKVRQFVELRRTLFDYFGYDEGDVILPVDECLDDYWFLTGSGRDARYVHSKEPFTEDSIWSGDNIYSGLIHPHHLLSEWIFWGQELTMVCVNTQKNSNVLLLIFDNEKHCADHNMVHLFLERWAF